MRHDHQDRVSLEIARRIASELPRRPEWVALARANLDRWTVTNHDAPALLRCYNEWRSLLERPVVEVCAAMTAATDEGQRLRQNSPFAGALPSEVIRDIRLRLDHEQTAA